MSGRVSQRWEREVLRTAWRREGWTIDEIAAAFTRRYRAGALRAYRWANGMGQQAVADVWNGLDAGGEARMTASRICEYEQWPYGGRRPSLDVLNRLSRIYKTRAASLFDGEDHRHLDRNWRGADTAEKLPLAAGE
jgi:transcriptional regulator with XRE-family HTH domain